MSGSEAPTDAVDCQSPPPTPGPSTAPPGDPGVPSAGSPVTPIGEPPGWSQASSPWAPPGIDPFRYEPAAWTPPTAPTASPWAPHPASVPAPPRRRRVTVGTHRWSRRRARCVARDRGLVRRVRTRPQHHDHGERTTAARVGHRPRRRHPRDPAQGAARGGAHRRDVDRRQWHGYRLHRGEQRPDRHERARRRRRLPHQGHARRLAHCDRHRRRHRQQPRPRGAEDRIEEPSRSCDLGDSNSLEVGDSVVAIGNALALEGTPTVTSGIISALHRTISTERARSSATSSRPTPRSTPATRAVRSSTRAAGSSASTPRSHHRPTPTTSGSRSRSPRRNPR